MLCTFSHHISCWNSTTNTPYSCKNLSMSWSFIFIFLVLKVHILPREMLGKSTFGLSMWLLKWLPIRFVDRFLLIVSWLMLGDTARFGLDRPKLGPLQLKNLSGKTPVLDVGTLAKIKSGHIKVPPLFIKSNQIQLFLFWNSLVWVKHY